MLMILQVKLEVFPIKLDDLMDWNVLLRINTNIKVDWFLLPQHHYATCQVYLSEEKIDAFNYTIIHNFKLLNGSVTKLNQLVEKIQPITVYVYTTGEFFGHPWTPFGFQKLL